tara:strand:- start:1241 stop:1447 length:207 start_codon:yes stop_codon:yes gene_type:complete
MTREDKIKKRKKRSEIRALKNGKRNKGRTSPYRRLISGEDCPYAVEINGEYGTCNCDGENEYECSRDI